MGMHQLNEATEQSGINEWGAGYFHIDHNGKVVCTPHKKLGAKIPLSEVVEKAKIQGIQTPMIIRFPQIIKEQMKSMHQSFKNATKEFKYDGCHYGVFPFKVNQRREFIDSIIACGRDLQWGLEVGSKTEFMAALSYRMGKNALLICNGFKDHEFIEMAFVASAMGKRTIIVVEGPDELQMITDQMKKSNLDKSCWPDIGLRIRLSSKGSGKWENSSGDTSKFGLTIIEIMHALSILEKAGLKDKLKMLHFHVGSQVTAIKRFKMAIREAARIYTKIHQLGFAPQFLNIGGGVGVDYDGSRTSAQSSANYTLQEFANDAVYVIGEVCKAEKVTTPDIITESGRVIAAYHSVIVTDIREVQGQETLDCIEDKKYKPTVSQMHNNLKEFEYILENMSSKNFNEYYHDAVELNEDVFSLFNLGYLSLKERAFAEDKFHMICLKAISFASLMKHPPEEFIALKKMKVAKYLANFSIFQSIPDSWAIDQLFPVLPIDRHNEIAEQKGKIVDITCDSDGCIDRYADIQKERSEIDLHKPNGKPYYLGFFLSGAYQESLANEHNLFGAINEVEVVSCNDESWEIRKLTKGDPIKELLVCRNYNGKEMIDSYRSQLQEVEKKKELSSNSSLDLLKRLKAYMHLYPYLKES